MSSSIVNSLNPSNWSGLFSTPTNNQNTHAVLRTATVIAGANIFYDGIRSAGKIERPTIADKQVMPIAKATTQIAVGALAIYASVKNY